MDTQEMGASLQETFAAIPDFRNASGRRHSLPAILTLAVCAMLSGARSLYAIHQWGRCQDPGTVRAMGFTHAKTPAVSCLYRVFSGLDVAAFETAVACWSQQHPGVADRQAVAVDGKALRGIHGEELPGVRLVAGYAHGSGLVLGQRGVRPGQGELTAARELTAELLPVQANLITGDALYCHREYCRQIREAGGDYLVVVVKKNQPELYADIALAFGQRVWGGEYRDARRENRHGGRQERRRLWATGVLKGYLDWPGWARYAGWRAGAGEGKGPQRSEIRDNQSWR